MKYRPCLLLSADVCIPASTVARCGMVALLWGTLMGGTLHAERPATYWSSMTGDFYDFSNWHLGAPGATLDGRIDNGGIAQITYPVEQTIPYVYLGSQQYTAGTLEISGEGVANFTTMIVGALNATGTLKITSGGQLTSFGGPIGSDYLGVGYALVDGAGSSWKLTGSEMVIGGNGTGNLLVQNSGSFTVANGNGRIQLGNHPVSEGNLYIGNGGAAGTFNANEIYNGEGRGTVTFNHSDPAYAFAPKFTGLKTVNGYLNVLHNGPGTTILTAVESNLAGTVTVAAGTLIVNGKIMGSVREALEENEVEELVIVQEKTIGETLVQMGGTLGGSGFLEGKTTVQGKLSPGMGGLGVLKFGGDLSLESTGTVTMELGGELRGVQFDGLDVAGALLYGGTLNIVLLNGFEPETG
ncbi:MAG: hypothetical protein EOP84_17670, partial [Verrucomicrobiaceae bacterium]